jgi:cell division septum initiation protein DivIVA
MTSTPHETRPGGPSLDDGRPDVSSTSVGALIGEVTNDLSTLMRQELELAKAELKQEASKTGKAAGMLGGAGFAASTVADAASSAPQAARHKAQGNPLAAGVIAFGAGWLISSLLPASEKEQRAAVAVKDKASEHSDVLTAPLSEAAQNLREPAQQAVESVKSTATDAASTVKDETRSAKDEVAGRTQEAKDTVTDRSGTSNGSPATGSAPTYGS